MQNEEMNNTPEQPNEQAIPKGVEAFATRLLEEGTVPEDGKFEAAEFNEDSDDQLPLEKNENVHATLRYSSKYHNSALNLDADGVAIPDRRINDKVRDFVDNNFYGDPSDLTVNYALTFETGRKVTPTVQGLGEQAIDRKGSSWKQFLETERGKVSFLAPRAGDSGMGKANGRRALQRARSMMGLGGEVSIPLLRSGFWVTISAPQDSDLIELNRRIANEKIEFGRMTHGLAFANQESFMMGWLVDFAIRHIVDSTLKNQEDLKSRIDVLDYHTLLWGLVKTIYPRGYNYTRAITTTAGDIRERKLVTALIDVTKIFWVDNNFFTEKQKAHMAHRQPSSVTDDAVAEYRKALRLSEGRTVELFNGVSVVLQVPNVQQQVDSAHTWITEINTTIDSTFTAVPPEDEERNRLIGIHSRTSQTRNYASWVGEVLVEGEDPITDIAEINEFLTDLSKNETASAKFIEEIKRFINDSTASIIAVPETDGNDSELLPEFPQLIPINVASTFFILLVQSVKRIVVRKPLV